jgi:DNA helicase-2/ATP-dependent DNA helicase PcrA
LQIKTIPVEHFLDQLNDVQRRAVTHEEGPMMVVAGAGSGKTRVLTYRIAYLLSKGVDPFHILSLTFTNKAAREMKDRVTKLVGTEARSVWMGTFHAVFARILRMDGHNLGYSSNFTIYDTDDSKRLIRTIIKELQLDKKIYPANVVLGRISASKNNLIDAKAYNQNEEAVVADKASGRPFLGKIFSLYDQRLFKANAMDFDDLLFKTNILLRDFPEVLYKYQNKFRYILVDEYQDTNYSQYLIVKKLAANNENICVVGDDAQSIYAFRGANIQNILNYQNDYPDVAVYKLEQNYRSTQTIVNAANQVIANNKKQIRKTVWTKNDQGQRIRIIKANSDTEEGALVAGHIFETKMNAQARNIDYAILYRTNAQSRAIEEALRKRNLPYKIYGGLSFYQRKEIKDLLAYFRLTVNPKDEDALLRIINFPSRGIGQTSQQKLIIAAQKNEVDLWTLISNSSQYGLTIGSVAAKSLFQFKTMIESFTAQLHKKNAFELAKHIVATSGLLKHLNTDKTPEGISRSENIEELLNAIYEFTEKEPENENSTQTLDGFMQDVALLTDQDDDEKNNSDRIALMTIHAAKGLEFPYVYVMGMEENLFPSMQSLNTRDELEEERRLFYVALTRAKKSVTLSYAETRYRWGNLLFSEPSRFLDEIDEQFLELPRTSSGKKPSEKAYTRKHLYGNNGHYQKKNADDKFNNETLNPGNGRETDNNDAFQAGMEVMHQKFGKGKILTVEGSGPNRKAIVFFKSVGQKNLLLKFARLKIIN